MYGIFPMWRFVLENLLLPTFIFEPHILIISMSYLYQLNLVAPPNKIFGLQEETREKIKQEETKVQMYLSKLPNLFVPIENI